jgi:hypothetical protein
MASRRLNPGDFIMDEFRIKRNEGKELNSTLMGIFKV